MIPKVNMADKNKPIIVGADHNGLSLKNAVRDYLRHQGYRVDDAGVNTSEPVNYPDIGKAVAEAVIAGKYDRGILVCGTGAGMAIVANKVRGVRAVAVSDPYTAERARTATTPNLTIGSQVIGPEVAKKLVDIWLDSEFQGGQSAPKVAKIDQLDYGHQRSNAIH